MDLFATLMLAAATLGTLHSATPDHWVPFAAIARARAWNAWRTAQVASCCGFAHVTVSALLGLLALVFGRGLLETIGHRMEAVAGILLVAFGIAYAMWGLRNAAGRHFHGHTHRHYDHVHDPSRTSAWALVALFSADPCVAVIPLLFAAAPLGVSRALAIVVCFEVATITTMVVLALCARAGVNTVRHHWLDHYGDVTAGGVIAVVGITVAVLGW